MKITQTRLKQIIQEELAAVQEAAGDGSGTGVSKEQRDKDRLKAARVCNSKKGKQWDPTELTGPGLFSAKLERACKDKVKENVNSQEPRYVDMDEVGEILKAKFESDAWDLRHNGDPRPEEVAADQLLNYVTNHINRLATKHLKPKEGELDEGTLEEYGIAYGIDRSGRVDKTNRLNKPTKEQMGCRDRDTGELVDSY